MDKTTGDTVERSEVKSCVDCHHYKEHRCEKFSYKDSTYQGTYKLSAMSQRGPHGDCGPDGKGFEKK